MREIWQEWASFQTSQRLADQDRIIIKKSWFSNLEMLEIHQKMNNEQDSKKVPDTSNVNKQNSPTKVNNSLWKMETPHNQTTQNKH